MRNTENILNVNVDKVTMEEAISRLELFLSEEKAHSVYTPNAEIMYDALKDDYLKNVLNSGDMTVADGAGVILASKILGKLLPEKVSGIDLVKHSFSFFSGRKIKYFLFGGKPGIAEAAIETITREYPGVEIAGCRNGYFSSSDEQEIIKEINSSNADILLVALGAPKQEKWIHEHKTGLKVRICIGVGGSLDVFAGKASLAPEFFRRNGLEWLYRLYKEPWRFKRMLKLPKYIILVLLSRLKGN